MWFTRALGGKSETKPKVLFGRSSAYAALGLFEKSLQDLELCCDQEVGNSYDFWELGMAFQGAGNHTIAKKLFDRSIELGPDHVAPYYHKAELDLHHGQIAEAIFGFSRVIELEPEYDYGFAMRGKSYAILGDLVRARSDFERALEINDLNEIAIEGINKLRP